MLVLGIESSCDETAAAIINDKKEILGESLLSQKEHEAFGGVVPEIAARAHLEHIDEMIEDTLKMAKVKLEDLDAIAAVGGPGLIGGVVVGAMAGKALSLALNKPLVMVNHLEGHALAPRISNDVEFPYLLLLVSGGHCQILIVKDVGEYERLGTTIDDAAGEAFDKVAKMLCLGYPGGPIIEKMAATGNPDRFVLPRPLLRSGDCNMSFSGLKTAVRKLIESYSEDGSVEHCILNKEVTADICASFQVAVTDCLVKKLENAIEIFKEKYPEGKDVVVSGGVAANSFLRKALKDLSEKHGLIFAAPPLKYCTDNGVMIAWAGLERFRKGLVDDLDFKPRPRWPLDEKAAAQGAKA
ncbi:MAG: tRNA (adenosine(37)-N6)-threonylcarbamoyltransferase complex transferase subunit TsaD [Lactobacillus sp.]|jgi:N6-L-threonylcarbamoyladenine synthase|nr:tRNA (adenosine(37)-N6)-threonylcarbamoyltransferase complex transferase subunit TsaD [Lactobacillus sp.]